MPGQDRHPVDGSAPAPASGASDAGAILARAEAIAHMGSWRVDLATGAVAWSCRR